MAANAPLLCTRHNDDFECAIFMSLNKVQINRTYQQSSVFSLFKAVRGSTVAVAKLHILKLVLKVIKKCNNLIVLLFGSYNKHACWPLALCAASLCHLILSFPGQVLLHAAFRQPSSLWNCISNILFRALSGRISVAHSYHGSIAASQDSKWSQEPWSQPPFFLFIDKPPSFCSKSCLCLTPRPGLVSEEQWAEAKSQSRLECLKWTSFQSWPLDGHIIIIIIIISNSLHLSTLQELHVVCGSVATHIYCINTW